jgi:septal ring factor EnvC (AmiA/AmiB activator)
MGEIALEMIWKRLDEMQAGIKGVHEQQTATRQDLAHLNKKVDGQASTLVGIRRELRELRNDVGMLLAAVDDHSRRLTALEKGEQPPTHHV